MTPMLSARLMIVLSILYAILIAILGFLDSSAITLVAVIGALVLGGLWAIRGLLARRSS
jgi:hypothetical protein